MGYYIFSVVSSDGDTCIGRTENFRTAFQLLYNHLSEYSDNTYIDMYRLPNESIKGYMEGGEFVLQYCGQTIFSDDYESMNIEYHCILEGTCCDDIKAVGTISELCDLSFRK